MLNKKIYVVRETRCGGSLLFSYIRDKISQRWNISLDENNFHDTHDFNIMDDIVTDPNAFIIRIDRRNLLEHFLSQRACAIVNWKFTNLSPEEPNHPLWHRIKNSKIEITDDEVKHYIKTKIDTEVNFMSKVLTYKIPYYRVWYEDALQGHCTLIWRGSFLLGTWRGRWW
jgi:hypothetical protein